MSGEGEEIQPRDYESEARQLGWHPQAEFRGNADDWVDAETFVRRGEQQLPIMRENNRKLTQRVRAADERLADMQAKLEGVTESLRTLRTMAEKSNEAGYQRALADLKAQQREAVKQGDEATFDRIQGEIEKVEETREQIAAAPPKPPDQPERRGPKTTPEFQAWFEDNKDWLMKDQTLANAATKFEVELRTADEVLNESELWDRVTELVKGSYPRRWAAATGEAMPQREPERPVRHDQPAPNLRRAASVLTPSGGAPPSQRKGGIDAIQDPTERAEARKAFARLQRSITDYTEDEYMKVYVNPGADVIGDSIRRKVKANGSARA